VLVSAVLVSVVAVSAVAVSGAGDLEDAWIRARLGEDGYLAGKDAETTTSSARPTAAKPR
jgi:hypothetical protein